MSATEASSIGKDQAAGSAASMGENERRFYNNKYDLYMKQILNSSGATDGYEKLSTQEKETALQEIEALLLRISIEKDKSDNGNSENQNYEVSGLAEVRSSRTSNDTTSSSKDESKLQTQQARTPRLKDSPRDNDTHANQKELALFQTTPRDFDSVDTDEESNPNSMSLDLLATSIGQDGSTDGENSASTDEGDETKLSIDLLIGNKDAKPNGDQNSSFDDSEATPDLGNIEDDTDAGDCSSVELGRTKRSSRIQSPLLVGKSSSAFDHEATPELSSTRFHNRNGKRLPSSSGKKGADFHRVRLSMHHDFDDNDKYDNAYTSLARRFSTFEGSPLLSQRLDCEDRGRTALSQVLGSQSPITPCLDDVVMIDDPRNSRIAQKKASFHNLTSTNDDSFPRQKVQFDDVLSPPTPTQGNGMEESESCCSFNNAVEDVSDESESFSEKRNRSRVRAVKGRNRLRNETQFHPRNLNITQSRFGSRWERRDLENFAQNNLPSNDTIEDTERAIMFERRKRQVARPLSRRVPGLENDSFALNHSVLCHDENDDTYYPSLDKPRVQLKEGASVRVVPLAIKSGRRNMTKNNQIRNQKERGPLRARDGNTDQILSLPDPVSSVFSGRMSERLDAVVEWLASKVSQEEFNQGHNEDINDNTGVVFSLHEKKIQAVVLKLLRISSKPGQKSTLAFQGGCLIVLREKDESMERWECSFREKSSFSVLCHARLGAASRKRLPFSRISGYDVVITTYDAMKGKEKVYTMDPHTNQPTLNSDKRSYGRNNTPECSAEWLSGSSSVDGTRRQCKELSMLHGIQWTTVVYLDVLGRGGFLLKPNTARALAAGSLTAQSRFLFFESTDRSPESLVKKFKEDGKNMRTVATFLRFSENMAAEDVLGGMVLDFEDMVVGKNDTHASRFEKSRESLLSRDTTVSDGSCSSLLSDGMADTSSFLNTTTQPYDKSDLRPSLHRKKTSKTRDDEIYTSSDEEEIPEPL